MSYDKEYRRFAKILSKANAATYRAIFSDPVLNKIALKTVLTAYKLYCVRSSIFYSPKGSGKCGSKFALVRFFRSLKKIGSPARKIVYLRGQRKNVLTALEIAEFSWFTEFHDESDNDD